MLYPERVLLYTLGENKSLRQTNNETKFHVIHELKKQDWPPCNVMINSRDWFTEGPSGKLHSALHRVPGGGRGQVRQKLPCCQPDLEEKSSSNFRMFINFHS